MACVADVVAEAVEGVDEDVDTGFVADVAEEAVEGVDNDVPKVGQEAEIDVGGVAESFEEVHVLPPHFRDRDVTVCQRLFSASQSLAPSIASRSESSNSESHSISISLVPSLLCPPIGSEAPGIRMKLCPGGWDAPAGSTAPNPPPTMLVMQLSLAQWPWVLPVNTTS